MASLFPETMASLRARFSRRRRPPAADKAHENNTFHRAEDGGGGDTTGHDDNNNNSNNRNGKKNDSSSNLSSNNNSRGGDLDLVGLFRVPLAIEMLAGRRTVRCQQCATHLFVPNTSPANPTFRCKSCWCLMADPLWAPARETSASAGSSVTTISEGPPRESDGSDSSDSSDSSSESGESNDESLKGGDNDAGIDEDRPLPSLDDQDWILLDNAPTVGGQAAGGRDGQSQNNSETSADASASSAGRREFKSDNSLTSRRGSIPRSGDERTEDHDGLVMLPGSPTRESNAAFFDDDVELVETFYE